VKKNWGKFKKRGKGGTPPNTPQKKNLKTPPQKKLLKGNKKWLYKDKKKNPI